MTETSIRGVVTAAVGLALVFATGSIRFLGKPSVETPYSTPPGYELYSVDSELERVNASLWEDPYEAYERELKKRADRNELLSKVDKAKGAESDEVAEKAPEGRTAYGLLTTPLDLVMEWMARPSYNFRQEQRRIARCEQRRLHGPPASIESEDSECRSAVPVANDRHIIVISSPTASQSSNAEMRRQIRVSLQTAMRSHGWATRDETAIGLTTLRGKLSDPSGSCSLVEASSIGVPFETFAHTNGARALVVWVDERSIQVARCIAVVARSLEVAYQKALARQQCAMAPEQGSGCPVPQGSRGGGLPWRNRLPDQEPNVAVIGPTSSKVLLRWLSEQSAIGGCDAVAGDVRSATECPQKAKTSESGAQSNQSPSSAPTASGPEMRPPGADTKTSPRGTSNEGPATPMRRVRLYSPASSIPERSLLSSITMLQDSGESSCTGERDTLTCALRQQGLEFIRANVTDDAAIEMLTNELRLRRAAIQPRECNVLVVTEADSAYSRWFKEELERRLPAPPGGKEFPQGPCMLLEAKTSKAIGSYEYLRGINVLQSSASPQDHNDRTSAPGGGGISLYPSSEYVPEGRQQFDYIGRLAGRIAREVREGRWDSEHVFGIGLFGIDVHDKVSLLKVLRPKFPHARFITTELETVYLDPANLPYTRNLIIASAYGLESDHIASGMPPFRRSGQVAYARAFSAAIEDKPSVTLPRTVGLYEVGLKGFVRLNSTMPEPSDVSSVRSDPPEFCGALCQLARKSQALDESQYLGGLLLLVVLGGLIFWLLITTVVEVERFVDSRALRPSIEAGQTAQVVGIWIRGVAVAIAAVATLYFWFKAHGAYQESVIGKGEPLVLFEGVSLWIPVLIRGLAITIGVVALVVYFGRDRRWERQIARKYRFLSDAVRNADQWYRQRALLKKDPTGKRRLWWFKLMEFLPFGQLRDPRSAALMWCQMDRKTCTLPAVAFLVGLTSYALYLGLLTVMDDPTIPSRGANMASLNRFANHAAGIVMFTLAFAVFLKQSMLVRYFESILPEPWRVDGLPYSKDGRPNSDKTPASGGSTSSVEQEIQERIKVLAAFSASAGVDQDFHFAVAALLRTLDSVQADPNVVKSWREEIDELREKRICRQLLADEDKVLLEGLEERGVDDAARLLGDADAAGRVECQDGNDHVRGGPTARRLVQWSATLELANDLLGSRTWPSYIPIAMVSLLALARVNLFENQTWPPVVWVFFIVIAAISLLNAYRLYRIAHTIKTWLLDKFEEQKYVFKAKSSHDSRTEALFDSQIARIRAIRRGPFAPFAEQPFVMALGIPISGTLIIELIGWSTGAK